MSMPAFIKIHFKMEQSFTLLMSKSSQLISLKKLIFDLTIWSGSENASFPHLHLDFQPSSKNKKQSNQQFVQTGTVADQTVRGRHEKTIDREKRQIDRDFCADSFLTAVETGTSWDISQKLLAKSTKDGF